MNACPSSECEYRLGAAWMRERLAGEREPHLRASVDTTRLAFVRAGAGEEDVLVRAAAELRDRSARLGAPSTPARLRKRLHG